MVVPKKKKVHGDVLAATVVDHKVDNGETVGRLGEDARKRGTC